LFARDDRLAQADASMHTGPFRHLAMLSSTANSATAAATATASSPAKAAVSAASPPLAATAAASATAVFTAAATNTNDGSEESYCVVINEPPRVVGNKGKTPFVCLSGNVRNVISDKLNKNWSKVNPNSSSTETMRVTIQSLIVNREYLISLAGGLDATMETPDGGGLTIKDMLTRAIHINIPAKTGKSKLCKVMVNVWAVFKPVSANVSIGHVEMHDLQQYIKLMTRVEMTVRREIQEADKVDKNSKTYKLSSHVIERMYLADRGKKPPSRFSLCAKCGHSLVDEPPFNKDVARKDKKLEEKWKADKIVIKNYDKTSLNPLLDSKGAIVTKLKNPTYGDKVIMCHCWQNFQLAFVGGSGCLLSCYDSKTKIQYEAGKCPVCQ
jgi:hypothetical protein